MPAKVWKVSTRRAMNRGTLSSVAFLSLACSSQKCEGMQAPSAGDETTVILKLQPEDMTFESDPKLDGSGQLVVEVFDTPHPFRSTGRARALYERRFPAGADGGGELSLRALPAPRLTLRNAPSTLYVRVTFFDDAQASASEELL